MALSLRSLGVHSRPLSGCRASQSCRLSCATRPAPCPRQLAHRQSLPPLASISTSSIDPLASRTEYVQGFTLPVHSEKQLDSFTNDGTGRLVIVMCKSSHCKPCKAFMQTYHQFAERFIDCVLLEVVGDESPELRKMMKSWEVKVTPTFRLLRDGKLVETVTGTGNSKLLKAILANLKEEERGRDYAEATHEELASSLDDDGKS